MTPSSQPAPQATTLAETTPAPTLPAPGTPVSLPARFGDYELLEEIARGGMGVVYRARQVSLGRVVAVKMILGRVAESEEAVERFHREARAAAALDHPNIVAVHASGQHDGRPYFVMAYVEGDNLNDLVRREGLPAPRRAAELLRAVAGAVEFAHGHDIIHRDLKPENVLVDRQGRPRVTDFGLACQLELPAAGDRLTYEGQVLGTPAYMSPEQAMTRHESIGPATDVYSLGGILYFLLTGRPPFQGRSATEVLCRVVTQAPTPPRQLNRRAPADLEAVCLRCLEKDPERRYPSAEALAAALGAAARAAAPGPLGRRWSRRIGVGLAVVALLGIAAGVWVASSGGLLTTASASTDQAGGTQPAPPDGAAQRQPPQEPRKDFDLTVAMVGQVELKPGPDGLLRLKAGDRVQYRIKVDQAAYVGVWSINADGTIDHLFPNEGDRDNYFEKCQERLVPSHPVRATTSKGTDWLWVQASTYKWAFEESRRVGPFALFQTERGSRRNFEVPTLAEAVLQYRVDPQ
jgi:hypothetical protein